MTNDLMLKAYRIRCVELEIARRYSSQRMRCPVHLSVGQELNAVRICDAIEKDDYMVSTHRGHAHYLAKGGSLKKLIAELHGLPLGCSGGHGGSMHLVDWNVNFAGSTSIVAGTIPVGVGLAWASKLNKENRVTVICIGDAAVEEGVFHEAANFASLHKLPVIFYCENNRTSCYTDIRDRQPSINIERFYGAHRFLDLFYDIKLNIPRARNLGPILVTVPATRISEHCGPEIADIKDELSDFDPGPFKELIEREIKEAFELCEQQ